MTVTPSAITVIPPVRPVATSPARIHACNAAISRKVWRLRRARHSGIRAAQIWTGTDSTPRPKAMPIAVGLSPRSSVAKIWKIAPPSMPNADPNTGPRSASGTR